MTTDTTDQTPEQGKKRKRLTLEEQIARQQELLEKDKENLAKKQKRLRSLNASKMNKDRIQSQKKRNSMLIQLGLFFIEEINNISQGGCEEFIDVKEEEINIRIEKVEEQITNEENLYNEKHINSNTKEAKISKKFITDKKILLEALENMKLNQIKYGKARLTIE